MEARMLKVDDYAKIRCAHRDGLSIRERAGPAGSARKPGEAGA